MYTIPLAMLWLQFLVWLIMGCYGNKLKNFDMCYGSAQEKKKQ